MKRLIRKFIRPFGIDFVRYDPAQEGFTCRVSDLTEEEKQIIRRASTFTMTSTERLATLINTVDYIVSNKVPGDIAECGVWRGGSMMAVALALLARNDRSRTLYLYDTFEGMSKPTEHDKSHDGETAQAQLERDQPGTGIWCYAGIDDVRANILSTGYPEDKIRLVQGKVEDTIPQTLPSSLALLRLDTDWYESTRHELTHLYPILHDKGILIIDDYGHWQGARQAVDEYFLQMQKSVYLHRIDYTGRLLLKSTV